jgi:hypothetical protein
VVYTIDETERVIVINRSNADYDSSLSSKGAQIFFVDNFDVELIDCQYSKREIELLVKDLSVQGRDVSSTLNSTITLQHYFRSPSNQDLVLAFQSASISLVKNNYRVNIGVRAAKGDDAAEFRMEYDPEERNTFSMKFDGEMSVVGSLDVVEYATFVSFPGDYVQDIMIAGQLRVLGRDLESVTMNVDNGVAVRFSVIAEGDIDGDFRPDQSGLYGSSWSDFLDRDFVRPAP